MKEFNDYTELESDLINGIINTWADTGCECSYLDDASKAANITMKVARGVASSLIKKGVVLECLPEYGFEVNLTEKGYELLGIEKDI